MEKSEKDLIEQFKKGLEDLKLGKIRRIN